MQGPAAKKRSSAATQPKHRPIRLLVSITSGLLAAVAPCVSAAHAGDGGSAATRRIVLSPRDLDLVTAGSLSIRINADAAAHGTTTFASALTTFEIDYGQALMVRVDPSPDPRPPKLMGTQELAVTHGSGVAIASGDQGADCSVTGTVVSPDLVASMFSSSTVTTATIAMCQCSLLAVSVVH